MRRSHETTAEIMDRMSEQLRPLAEAMQHDSGRPQGERSIAGMFLAMMGERSLRESTESRLRTAETDRDRLRDTLTTLTSVAETTIYATTNRMITEDRRSNLRDAVAAARSVVSADPCTGRKDCEASPHLHGCFADMGDCERPSEHGPVVSADPPEEMLTAATYKRALEALMEDGRLDMCGIVCFWSWHDPVACAFLPEHKGDHSWASIPELDPRAADPPEEGT